MMPEVNVTDHFFHANGLRHHYWRQGEGHQHTIVMLHGIRSYAKTWVKTASFLSRHFNVIALDLRGRGESDWSKDEAYFYGDYVADMAALIDHLNVDKVILLGHSLGGQNAFVYANQYPEKVEALIVEDIGPGSSASGEGAARIVREFNNTPQQFSSWAEATQFWRSIRPKISDESLAQRVKETLREDGNGNVVWAYDFLGIKNARLAAAEDTSKLPDLWPIVESLRCPTLVLRGGVSDFLKREVLEEMSKRNPIVQIGEVSGATHYVHDDNFDEFLSKVASFLEQVTQMNVSGESGV